MKERYELDWDLVPQSPLLCYDQQGQGSNPLIWTEVFLRQVNRQPDQTILHFWPMETTVILGLMDCQVPQLAQGIDYLKQAGYQPLVRSMGGLGVVADEGVLNVSLILPNPQGPKFDFHRSYLFLVALISQALSQLTDQIEAYEIGDSYCPGTYDLSIGGRKFAGLAQRIYQGAIVVSAYISLTGDQDRRGQLIAGFYQAGFAGQEPSSRYPRVNPASMASLSELLGQEIGVQEMKQRLKAVFEERGLVFSDVQTDQETIADFLRFQDEMAQRAEKYGL